MSYLEKSTFWKRSTDWLLQLTVIPRIILLVYILYIVMHVYIKQSGLKCTVFFS